MATKNEDCNVCCEKFNKIKKKVICNYCNFECCKHCVQTYLLNEVTENCMNCRKALSIDFLYDNLNKSYINNIYRHHKKDLLFEIEKSKMPSTIQLVERRNNLKLIKEKMCETTLKIKVLKEELRLLRLQEYDHLFIGEHKIEKREFRFPCPGENCKGFMNSKWKCGICLKKACNKCREIYKDDETIENHICNEDLVKSVELMKKENKLCPKCAIPIYKISGCDQMWCTQCQIAFSWKTGRIVNGPIHNPHYYQAQQLLNNGNGNNMRNPGDIVCGGLINNWEFRRFLRNINLLEKEFNTLNPNNIKENDNSIKLIREIFKNVHRGTTHNFATLDNMRNEVRTLLNNDELRIRYMTNEITEEAFKRNVMTKYKKQQKTKKLLDIFEMYNTIIIETINSFYNDLNSKIIRNKIICDQKIIKDYYDRIIKITHYTNKEFYIIGKNYNQKTLVINNDWTMGTNCNSKKYNQSLYHYTINYPLKFIKKNGYKYVYNLTENPLPENYFEIFFPEDNRKYYEIIYT